LLPQLVFVELPDPANRFEQRTRILPGNFRPAVGRLARVGGSADVHVKAAAAVEGNTLVFVLALRGQVGDDRLCGTRWFQCAGRHLVADNRGRRADVQVAVAQGDAGRAGFTEAFLDFV